MAIDPELMHTDKPLHWCFTHGRTLLQCYLTDGTVTVDRECNSSTPPIMEGDESID